MSSTELNWNTRYEEAQTPWDTGRASKELQRVLRDCGISPCRVLEVGCGTGVNAVYLAEQGFEVTAFDLAPLAIERARERAEAARVEVHFFVGDALNMHGDDRRFPFVFDRGVYHVLRSQRLAAYLHSLMHVTEPGSLYLTLAGNANDAGPENEGPPRVSALEMVSELGVCFELVQLREFNFTAVREGVEFHPLGWSGLWRRRH